MKGCAEMPSPGTGSVSQWDCAGGDKMSEDFSYHSNPPVYVHLHTAHGRATDESLGARFPLCLPHPPHSRHTHGHAYTHTQTHMHIHGIHTSTTCIHTRTFTRSLPSLTFPAQILDIPGSKRNWCLVRLLSPSEQILPVSLSEQILPVYQAGEIRLSLLSCPFSYGRFLSARWTEKTTVGERLPIEGLYLTTLKNYSK